MAVKRIGGRPNVARRDIDPIGIEGDGDRVLVAPEAVSLDLLEPFLVDDIGEVANNHFRDQNGRRVWTISFVGGGRLVLMYSKDADRLLDWECDGVRFEREGDQLFVMAGVPK